MSVKLTFSSFDLQLIQSLWKTRKKITDRSGEFCYNFLIISIDLTHMVNYPTQIPDYDSHIPALFDLFLSSNASICSAMDFPP